MTSLLSIHFRGEPVTIVEFEPSREVTRFRIESKRELLKPGEAVLCRLWDGRIFCGYVATVGVSGPRGFPVTWRYEVWLTPGATVPLVRRGLIDFVIERKPIDEPGRLDDEDLM